MELVKKIIFITPFNTTPFSKLGTTKQWNDSRFQFWLTHTMQSIIQQTYQDLEYWLICNDDLKHVTKNYPNYIHDPRVRLIYKSELINYIRLLAPADYYLICRIDSDDFYHENTAKFLLEQPIPEGKKAYMFSHGYAYEWTRGKLYYWAQGYSPCYTLILDSNFPNVPEFWLEDFTQLYKDSQLLRDRMMMISIHNLNSLTHINSGYLGREETDPVIKEEILKRFKGVK